MAGPVSRTQRFVLKLLPAGLAARAEAESKEWKVICGACGQETSWWELGGIRLGAWSKGKRMYRRCRACGKKSWQKVERRAA